MRHRALCVRRSQLDLGRRRDVDRRAAVTVACGDECRGEIVAEQRDIGDMGTVVDAQRSPRTVAGIARLCRGRVDVTEVDCILT